MNRLAKSVRSGNGSATHHRLLGFMAVLAMVFASLHAPAIAHVEHDGHFSETSVHHDTVQDQVDANSERSTSDGSSAIGHHHHCPAVALPDAVNAGGCLIRNREVYGAGEVPPLGSLAPQPLIDPPSL